MTASCVANNPYDIGNATASVASGWTSWVPNADTIYAVSITTPDKVTRLTTFRIAGSAAQGTCGMALYSNSTSNRPGSSLATGASFGVINGINGVPANVQVTLSRNTRYWILTSCTGSAALLAKSLSDSSTANSPLRACTSSAIPSPTRSLTIWDRPQVLV